jgi:hypothetical protein
MGLNDVGTIKETTEVILLHPRDGTPIPGPGGKPLSITLHGPYSERYKAVLRKQQQRRMQDMSRGAGRGALTVTIEEIEQNSDEIVKACLDGWNISFEGDEVLPMTPENIDAVFKAHPWVRDQIDRALGNVADFLAPSTTP